MPPLTIPSPDVPIATAKINIDGKDHLVEVKVSNAWFQALAKLVKQVNSNTP